MARIGLGPSGPPAPDPRAEDWWQSVYPTLRSAWDWTRGNPLEAASMSMVPGVSDVADIGLAGRDIGRFAVDPSRSTALDALLSTAGAALPVLGAATVKRAGTGAARIAGSLEETSKNLAKPAVQREIEARIAERQAPFDTSKLGKPSGPQSDLDRYDPRTGRGRGYPARIQRLLDSTAVREQVKAKIQRGLTMSGAEWYDTGPLKDAFIAEHGPVKGPEMHRKFLEYVAASSPRSDVASNIRNASYYFSRDVQGNPVLSKDEPLPFPYGHMAQGLHKTNAARIADPTKVNWDPKGNPKPRSFVENLAGNWLPVTVDAHALKLPAMLSRDPEFLARSVRVEVPDPSDPTKKIFVDRKPYQEFKEGRLSIDDAVNDATLWEAQPAENEYLALEQFYKDIAQEMGISPAQAQAAAWVGGGDLTNLESAPEAFMDTVNKRILRTSAIRDEPVEGTTRAFLRGERPLLSTLPVGLGLGLGARTLSQLGADEEPY
jgi:hypothetical protein